MEDTAVLVREGGVSVGEMCNAAKVLHATNVVSVSLALLGTNPVQIRLAAQVSCVPPAVRVIPA